jgi:predicted DNA-binding transcriptional regulator YafY
MLTATRFSLERLAVLDRAIRAGEYPNARIIANRLEVDPRTIQRDIQFLRDRIGAPLAYDAVRHGYYYTEPDYRLPAVSLTEGELVAIFLAERALQSYRGTPYAGALARVFRKLAEGLTERVTIDLAHLDRIHSFRTTAAASLDPARFAPLTKGLLQGRRLLIRYYSASRDEEIERRVDPYHLASVNGNLYLIGYCHRREEVRMFSPERIRAVALLDETFDLPPDFAIDAYLADSFAVLRGEDGERHHVRLRFTGEAVKYVRERTWHPSQTTESQPDGSLVLGFTVSHPREIERWALSWGADCEVLEPGALRDGIRSILERSLVHYGDREKHSRKSPSRRRREGHDAHD